MLLVKMQVCNKLLVYVKISLPLSLFLSLGEMIDKLTLTYNRTRQAVITRELIEIISGAAAL